MRVRPREEDLREPPFQGMASPSYDNINKDEYYYLEVYDESDNTTDYFLVEVTKKRPDELKVRKLAIWIADTWIERSAVLRVPVNRIGSQFRFREPTAGGKRGSRKGSRKARSTRKRSTRRKH